MALLIFHLEILFYIHLEEGFRLRLQIQEEHLWDSQLFLKYLFKKNFAVYSIVVVFLGHITFLQIQFAMKIFSISYVI